GARHRAKLVLRQRGRDPEREVGDGDAELLGRLFHLCGEEGAAGAAVRPKHRQGGGRAACKRAAVWGLERAAFTSNHKLASWPGLSPQVGFIRLAAVNSTELGHARVPLPSTSPLEAQKTWMPAASARSRASSDALCAGMTGDAHIRAHPRRLA